MAWLKMNHDTPEKPEVLAITARMGWDDPDLTIGKLFKLWRWFDLHTAEGNARGVTASLLNRQLGVTGFIEAVADVGWLVITGDGVELVNFDRHNGETAKTRASTALRVAKSKAKKAGATAGNGEGNEEGNADTVTKTVPRERERERVLPTTDVVGKAPRKRSAPPAPPAVERPEDVAEQTWADWLALRKAKKAPVTETVVKAAKREAVEAGITLDAFLAIWCMRGSQGLDASWLQPRELQQARQRPPVQTFRERDAEAGMRRWEEMTGQRHPDRDRMGTQVIEAPATSLKLLESSS